MICCVRDERSAPVDPCVLRDTLLREGVDIQMNDRGALFAEITQSFEMIFIARALDAVIEIGVEVDGSDVGSWMRIMDRPEESDYPEPMSCPFCGEPARIMCGPEDWVQCTGCGAMSEFSASPENAVKKWNRRVSHV